MKHFKRLFSYLVALTMVLSLAAFAGVNVHAKTGNTLTLSGTKTGHTYEVYQIFTGNLVEKDGNKVLSNVQWGTGVTSKSNADPADVAKRLDTNYNEQDKLTIDNLVDDLSLTKALKTVTSSDSTTTINDLPYGYYLVKDEDGTQNDKSDAYTKFIVQVVGDTTAAIKSDVPSVTKKVKDKNDSTGATSEWQDSADYDIGDTVPYQITGTMPSNIADYTTYKYVFTDTMSKGLTYSATAKENSNNYTIKVYPDGDDENNKNNVIDITNVKDSDGNYYFRNNGAGTAVTTGDYKDGKEFTWTCSDLKAIPALKNKDGSSKLNANSVVTVEYKATLNENALLGSAGNPNKVDLTYSNNPNNTGNGETGKTPEDKNIVFTYKVDVNKVDQDKKSLAGAAFKLEKKSSDGSYKTVKEFTAGTETSFEFTGLDDGDYRLTETTTPSGYNTITPIEFTISAEHDETSDNPALTQLSGNVKSGTATFTADKSAGSLTTNVVNKKGSTLPSTGGMGTTLLYAVGGVLVACAVAYVMFNKKHAK